MFGSPAYSLPRDPVPGDAAPRLKLSEPLHRQVLLGTGLWENAPEAAFDRMRALACRLWQRPLVMIALLDGVATNVFNPQRNEPCWLRQEAFPQFLRGKAQPYPVHAPFSDATEGLLAVMSCSIRAAHSAYNPFTWPFDMKELG